MASGVGIQTVTEATRLLGTVRLFVLCAERKCRCCCVSKVPERGLFLFMRYDAFSRCHPLTNFLFFLGAIGCAVVIQHPAYILLSCICGGCYGVLLNGRKGVKLLLAMIPVFALLSALNPLFSVYGERTLFWIFDRPYNLESLYYGMAVSGIFVAMILWFGCYSAVLTSDKFIY